MNDIFLFWAKLGSELWPTKYHPAICHLIDVGQVARRLWDDVCRARIKEWVRLRLGLPDEQTTGAWLAFWVAAHDIGKICPGFQVLGDDPRTTKLRACLPEPLWDYPTGKTPHATVSTAIAETAMRDGLGWPAVDKKIAQLIAIAIGGHHGFFPAKWDDFPSHIGNVQWNRAQQHVLKELARQFEVTELPAPNPPVSVDQSVWMYIAGLTSVADWIGSNVEFFPPFGSPSLADGQADLDAYFGDAANKASIALGKLGWLDRVDKTTPITFGELFPFNPRPLQTAVAELVGGMTEPGLLIVESPMGEGKTEAGWFAAASWERRGGQGSYIALPTMATSNQMFGRVAMFLSADGEGKKNLILQHGKAVVNEKFDDLKYKARLYDEEKQPSAVVAEGWFAANKKHGLLAPYGVGTIDQVLLAVLQVKHVFVRLFGLAGKCVILDEVHAYDAYMTTLLERLLRWLAALGCPVVLLSATLPKDKRLALLRAYVGTDVPEPEYAKYPRVTSVMIGGVPKATFVQADPTRAKTVQLGWVAEDRLIDQLKGALANGGCAAVIRNTVGLAQETFLRLRESLEPDGIRVELFHARFPFGRRMKIEKRVLRRYGTKGEQFRKRRQRVVLVATQVIEQSLDLDFDLMISDVAPVDLVLQRAGRLHRHERGERPMGVREPHLSLIEPEMKEGVPDFGNSEYVYARYVLLKSHILLKRAGAIELPGDLERFVEQVYGTEPLTIPEQWEADLAKSQAKLIQERKDQRMKAKGAMIYSPDNEDLFRQKNLQLDEDNPEAAEKIRAATRDTEPSIQLIVVYHLNGQDYLDPKGTEQFDESAEPDIARIRRLLDNEVTIAHKGCVMHYVCCPVPGGWRKSGMLKNHRIVRIGPDGQSLTDDWIRMSRDLGIITKRKTNKEAD